MKELQQAILAEQDFTFDLTEFQLEGQMNDYFASKKLPQRVTCHWIDDQHTSMRIELRGYVQAIYIKADNTLYKVTASALIWALVQNAFKTIFEGVKCYE